MCNRILTGWMITLAATTVADAALAQPLDAFRWQLQPDCNVLTLNITQQNGVYTLDATDDRCGSQRRGIARWHSPRPTPRSC